MDTAVLTKLGLTENEIAVYVALLKSGPSLASAIAESTGLHRTHVYDILRALMKRELVFYAIRENRKYFEAKQPERLLMLLKEKEEELKQYEANLTAVIAELTKAAATPTRKIKAFVYQGKEGFKSLLNDILRVGKEYFVIGYTPRADEQLKYFQPSFHKKRIKLGISRKIIMDADLKKKWISKQKLQETRFLPKERYIPMGIILYGIRVVIVTIEEAEFTALVVENEKIYKNFRQFFDMLWEIAQP